MEGLAKIAAEPVDVNLVFDNYRNEQNLMNAYRERLKGNSRTNEGLPKMVGQVTPKGVNWRVNSYDFHQKLKENPEFRKIYDQAVEGDRKLYNAVPETAKRLKRMENLESPAHLVGSTGLGAGVGGLGGFALGASKKLSPKLRGLGALTGAALGGAATGGAHVAQRNANRDKWEQTKNNQYNVRHYSTPGQLKMQGMMRDIYEK